MWLCSEGWWFVGCTEGLCVQVVMLGLHLLWHQLGILSVISCNSSLQGSAVISPREGQGSQVADRGRTGHAGCLLQFAKAGEAGPG